MGLPGYITEQIPTHIAANLFRKGRFASLISMKVLGYSVSSQHSKTRCYAVNGDDFTSRNAEHGRFTAKSILIAIQIFKKLLFSNHLSVLNFENRR